MMTASLFDFLVYTMLVVTIGYLMCISVFHLKLCRIHLKNQYMEAIMIICELLEPYLMLSQEFLLCFLPFQKEKILTISFHCLFVLPLSFYQCS